MKLFHIIAIKHSPPEIREETVPFHEYERTFAALSRRYETVFVLRSFIGNRDERGGRP